MISSQLLAGIFVALLNLFATGAIQARVINELHSAQAADQFTYPSLGCIIATPQRDGAGNITGYVWSDGSTNTVTQTWTRGPGGRIESAGSDVPGAPSFDYLIDPQTPEESFDSYGRRLKCETAGGIWTYEYGTGGQLTSATHPTLGSFTYAFDGIGRRTDQGTANTTDILNRTTAWSHDQQKIITITADPNARVWFNGTEVTSFSGSHQEAVTPPGPEGGWATYDVLAILEDAGDGFGNPAPNPLASPDAKAEKSGAVWVPPTAETLTYDAAGNRQSSAQWDYGWNAQNQLTRIRTKDYQTAPQAYDLTYAYDSEGRRVKKHVVELQNGSVVSEKTVLYVWDGWDLLYERHQLPSGLTTLERKYLWGPDIADGAAGGAGGLLLIQETRGDTTTEIIPLYDGTGHVVALTDIEKNLLATYAYGPFGEKIHATGPRAQSNPWRWVTKYLDEETGLYYFGHRYFDPVTGQWLSREPLGESESINLYVYAGNDPINHVDVQGLAAVPLVKEIIDANPGLTTEEQNALWALDEHLMMFGSSLEEYVNSLNAPPASLYRNSGAIMGPMPELVRGDGGDFLGGLAHAGAELATGITMFAIYGGNYVISPPHQQQYLPDARVTAGQLFAANRIQDFDGMLSGRLGVNLDSQNFAGGQALGLTLALIRPSVGVLKTRSGQPLLRGGGAWELVNYVPRGARNANLMPQRLPQLDRLADTRVQTTSITPYYGQTTPTAWPGNRGSMTIPKIVILEKGMLIDRYGHEFGTFTSQPGTPFPMRAMKPEFANDTPSVYRVKIPFEVKEGLIAPAFNYPGMGIQYELPHAIYLLRKWGYLERVD